MEQWVGAVWHRWVSQAAQREFAHAAVHLAQVRTAVRVLFHAAGGAPTLRVGQAGLSPSGAARTWLQRIAGGFDRAALPSLGPEVLALPERIAVFDSPRLNRLNYLWLAAMAAHLPAHDDWIRANRIATERSLGTFPGLRSAYTQLLRAHLAQRPRPEQLKGAQAQAEAQIQAALQGEDLADALSVHPDQVAPVWLWLTRTPDHADSHAPPRAPPPAARAPQPPHTPPMQDPTRRRAKTVQDERSRAPLLMFFRSESLLSWAEHVKVDRANDDSDDPNALAAAQDMDELALTPADGQSTAAPVRFDLDICGAPADHLPLGPGRRLPEWDWRQGRLIADHCAVQTVLSQAAQPWVASAPLQAAARRVQRRLEALRAARGRLRAQDEGPDIDIDAWVRHQASAGQADRRNANPAVFERSINSERSLATLLLSDLSLSTDAHVWVNRPSDPDKRSARVIDLIRDALYVFGQALQSGQDPFAIYGFSSVRRHQVRIHQLKSFDETWGATSLRRLAAITPSDYTRMGTAIRDATEQLRTRPESQRLLLIISDGKPNDLDLYEGRYGIEDTRHAVQAARACGIAVFCVTIDHQAQDYLRSLFGPRGYALVHRPSDLVQRLPLIYAHLTRSFHQ